MLQLVFLFSNISPIFSPRQSNQSSLVLGLTSCKDSAQQIFTECLLGVKPSPSHQVDMDLPLSHVRESIPTVPLGYNDRGLF